MIGYSGHEEGLAISLAAIHLGAALVERHFTLDRNQKVGWTFLKRKLDELLNFTWPVILVPGI